MNKKLHQIYTVTDLLALQDDPDRWIVPQMIPKAGRSLVYGEGGHFKSSIVFDLCVAVASQGLLFNQLPVQLHGPVLLNTTEGSILDNKARILAHVRAHDLNPADMQLHICQQPFVLDDVLDVHELEYWLKEIKPVLTVLDPLDSFFAGDENSAKETKALRRVLDRLIDQHQTSMIVIHHKGKSDNGPRGSTAWTAWADSVLFVRRADKAIPGLKETMPIVTVESTKQRNGRRGHVFSAVPFFDDVRQEIRFTYYDGKDSAGVITAYYKQKIYELLSFSGPLTTTMLGELLTLRADRISELMEELERLELVSMDTFVERPCGSAGLGTRRVPAWRAIRRQALVERATIMVKAEDEEAMEYCIEPTLEQPSTVFGPSYLSSGICDNRVPEGSGVSQILQ